MRDNITEAWLSKLGHQYTYLDAIPLSAIIVSDATRRNIRPTGKDDDKIIEYGEALEQGADFPAVIVYPVKAGYELIAGTHRSAASLCGSMFGATRLRRHRLFESNVVLLRPGCQHDRLRDCVSVTGHAGGTSTRDGGDRFGSTALWREIMGIDWMIGRELAEAIPPAYTAFIGRQLKDALCLTP